MSRIAKRPIRLPDGVTVDETADPIVVKGPKGELLVPRPTGATAQRIADALQVKPQGSSKTTAALGLLARLLKNAITGVHTGFTRKLEVNGVGYRAAVQGKKLVLNVGFSHPVAVDAPEGIELAVVKNVITVSGIDKQLVGQVAANIRSIRKPEPYKGKGIKYAEEIIQRKAGKAAKAAGATA